MDNLRDVFASLESQLLANQKQMFLSFPNLSTAETVQFKTQMLSNQTQLERANIKAAAKAYSAAEKNLIKTIEKGYISGVNSVGAQLDKKLSHKINQRANDLIDNAREVLSRICNVAVNSSIAAFTGIISSLDNYKYADNLYQAVDYAQLQYLDKGIAGSVNSNGASINLSTFADIIEGEYEHSAILTGEGQARDETDNHYVVVSSHFGCCEKCARWENEILVDDVFSDGKPDGEHELLSVAISQGLFHPNCRHRFRVALNGESGQPKEKNQWTEKQNREQYQATQRQRQIERNIRAYKRREEGSLTDSERIYAEQKVREWQAKQRELIRETNKGGGPKLFREYERERIGGGTKPQLAQELEGHVTFSDDPEFLKLPYEQKSAVIKYISSESYAVNEQLRNGGELTADEKQFVDNLNRAIDKLPKVKGETLVRDITGLDVETYEQIDKECLVGEEFSFKQFASTTTNESYHISPQIRYIIRNASKAADITRINSGESEALYGSESKFKVLTKYWKELILVIELEEL